MRIGLGLSRNCIRRLSYQVSNSDSEIKEGGSTCFSPKEGGWFYRFRVAGYEFGVQLENASISDCLKAQASNL